MKHILALALFLYSAIAVAQTAMRDECNTEVLLQKSGTWKESSASSSGILATDLVKEKKTIATIHSMIKSKYSPMGVKALINGGYNSPYPTMSVNNYIYSIIPLEFYCDGNNIKPVGETSTYFQIGVNSFTAEVFDTAQGDRALMEGFNVLPQMPRSKDGYYYFDEKDENLPFGAKGKSQMWLITYDGKLPWTYVTKKEFLEKRRRNLATHMANDASHVKDVLKNIEIEKGYKEKEYKNDPEKLKKYMNMDYIPMKERYEKQLSDIAKNYEPAYKKIDDQLKKPANELNEVAIVKNDPKDYLSYLFTTENDPFGKILIKPNPGYFNKKLPRSTPQFISVYIIGNHKNPVVANIMTGLVNATDFKLLKGLLGK